MGKNPYTREIGRSVVDVTPSLRGDGTVTREENPREPVNVGYVTVDFHVPLRVTTIHPIPGSEPVV